MSEVGDRVSEFCWLLGRGKEEEREISILKPHAIPIRRKPRMYRIIEGSAILRLKRWGGGGGVVVRDSSRDRWMSLFFW